MERVLFVAQLRSLFSRINPAYTQISLKEIYAILQLLKKFSYRKSLIGLHDKAFKMHLN